MDPNPTEPRYSTEVATETKPGRSLAEEIADFGEHFPKIAVLVAKSAKYFGG